MPRPDLVRVRDKETGHHYSVSRAKFDRTPELWEELKSPAADVNGDPIPPKYKTSAATKAAGSKTATEPADRKADSPASTQNKEN